MDQKIHLPRSNVYAFHQGGNIRIGAFQPDTTVLDLPAIDIGTVTEVVLRKHAHLGPLFLDDFRQLEQGKLPDKDLLYTIQSGMYFENLLNAALILENDHRFKEDPEFGKMLTDMWFNDLSTEQKIELNKRVVMDKSILPKQLDDDCHYACPTNIHRNVVSANNFRKHIMATHR